MIMRFSLLPLGLLLGILVMECYGDPKYYSRKGYRRRPSYRRRYHTGCSYHRKLNCIVSQWHAWSSCTEDCGSTGVRNRARLVIRPAKCNGTPCPSLTQQQPCNRKCYNGGTPRPGICSCRYGYSGKCCEKGTGGDKEGFCFSKPDGVYGNPKDCTSFYHCAHGQTHLKDCTHGLHWNDKAKTCDWPEDAKCGKVDGSFGKWTAWSKCSATCGKGRQFRLRRCNNPPPSNGGADCHGSAMEMRDCILKHCAGNCRWKEWSSWSQCSAKCGCGSKKRRRQCSCDNDGSYTKRGYSGNNEHCQGKGEEEVDCNCHKCPDGNVNTESVGCFCDKNAPNRALPNFVAKFHGSTSAKDKISACAHLAQTLKVEYFGMQDGGECWVDRSGVNAYSKHGRCTNCKDGIGGQWANYVYKIVQ